MTTERYDLIIIGGGSGGLTAAGFAVQLGAHVTLVEKHRIGGDCTWTGCVPSKTLLKAAKVAHEMSSADRYGLTSVKPTTDLRSVMSHVREVIAGVYQHESPEALQADGIDVFLGNAEFLDSHTIMVEEATLTANHFLICTGAHPFIPPVPGLDSVNYLTYENIWDLEVLPHHLIIIGGGPIGCEMAQAFHRLGSKVTILEAGDRILPRDDLSASRVLTQVLSDEGIELRLNSAAEDVRKDGDEIQLVAGGEPIMADALLVAIGRRANVNGLGLDQAGVNYSPKGIQVDDHLRTSQGHIYAAGDCVGGYQFTHYAGWQAFAAVRNALLPGSSKGVTDLVPWTTFTDPEVAHIGLLEEEARHKFGDDVMVCNWPMDKVDRARAEGDTAGFVKLVHKKDGKLLGATIVASRAGETIHEFVLALDRGLKVGDLAHAIHIYPTYSTAVMQAAADIRVNQWLSSTTGRLVRGIARLIR